MTSDYKRTGHCLLIVILYSFIYYIALFVSSSCFVLRGELSFVEVLLSYGADPNITDMVKSLTLKYIIV